MTGELLTFAGIMALAQFSPGPDMILLTRTSLKDGARAGVEMAVGIACGLAVHTAIAVGGLSLAFDRAPVLRQVLGWVAAVYLLWLAWRIFAELFAAVYSGGKDLETGATVSKRRPFIRGLLCNLLNPKAAIVIAALCAPFLRGDRPDWWQLAIWGVVVGQGMALWSLWAGLLQWRPLRAGYDRSARWIDGIFAAALVALAVKLMLG